MGHGHSKGTPRPIGDDENGIRMYCRMDVTMSSLALIPGRVARRYCLEFEKYVSLVGENKDVYCCEVSQIDGKFYLTKGWAGFVHRAGVAVDDFMVFDIRGSDEIFVWIFPGNRAGAGSRVSQARDELDAACRDEAVPVVEQPRRGVRVTTGKENVASGGEVGEVSVDAVEDCVGAPSIVDQTASPPIVVRTRSTSTTSSSGEPDSVQEEHMFRLFEAWRGKCVLGKNVVLYDRQVQFIAEGLNWDLPEFGIYVGRVEGTSIDNNRMRLPKAFTEEHIMPLLGGERKTFFMDTGAEGARHLKFSIGKDGRASLTEGWTDFATVNGIRPGSLLAFSFSNNNTELDISIDFLLE